jgi:hypothetical protein
MACVITVSLPEQGRELSFYPINPAQGLQARQLANKLTTLLKAVASGQDQSVASRAEILAKAAVLSEALASELQRMFLDAT